MLPASELPHKDAVFEVDGKRGFVTDNRTVAWELLDELSGKVELVVMTDKTTVAYTLDLDKGKVIGKEIEKGGDD